MKTLIDLCQYGPASQFGPMPERDRGHGVLNPNENPYNAMERNLSTYTDSELLNILNDLDTLRAFVHSTLEGRCVVWIDCDACHRSGTPATFTHHPHCMLRGLSNAQKV